MSDQFKLIVGLGNVGAEYTNTRHNVGFWALDKLADQLKLSWQKNKNGEQARWESAWLLKPLTMMNNSGQAVSAVANFYKIEPAQIIIVHDDIDLPVGGLKIERGRGAAGHHGVESIIEHLGTKDFWRVRVGIAGEHKVNTPADQYVLSAPEKGEQAALDLVIDKVVAYLLNSQSAGLKSLS